MHVCEHVECKLPAEDWYQAGLAAKQQQQTRQQIGQALQGGPGQGESHATVVASKAGEGGSTEAV